jgi:Uma2 family endonuclease
MSQLLNQGMAQDAFLEIDLRSIRISHEQFQQLCRDNPDLRLELTSKGELIVMPPTGSKSGLRNSILVREVSEWAVRDGTGVTFDSSAGFTLPNRAIRSPDASWIRLDRWERLTNEQQEGFAPLCPDFVVELRSPTDRIEDLKKKMAEYIANGSRLGFLLDPFERRVYVYRAHAEVEVLEDPESVSGDPELPGLVLTVRELWC